MIVDGQHRRRLHRPAELARPSGFGWRTPGRTWSSNGGPAPPGPAVHPDAGMAAVYARRINDSGHPHVHGANLGIRGSTYLDVGGWANRPAHEDVALVTAVTDLGTVRIVTTLSPRARRTSLLDQRCEVSSGVRLQPFSRLRAVRGDGGQSSWSPTVGCRCRSIVCGSARRGPWGTSPSLPRRCGE